MGTSFKIYNASAGSGKTYALSKAYLKIVLHQPNAFRRILAITFTNKAVNEMKNRILNNLYEFSRYDSISAAPPLMIEMAQELQLAPEELALLSKKRLKEILHNYAFFDVSTIDKFTHRLIRTFSRDLRLPQNFEVILDTDFLLNEAVERVMARAGEDMQLTKVLMDFAVEKIEDNRSWDITFDLLDIGKLLFNENNVPHLTKLASKPLADFLDLQKNLQKRVTVLEEESIDVAKQALAYLDAQALGPSDFLWGMVPKHFAKIADGEFSPSILYSNQLEKRLLDKKVLKAGTKAADPELENILLNYYHKVKKCIYQRDYYRNAYRNIVPLSLLNEIQKEVKNIQVEKDQLSISEFNLIISNEIKNQPAPFIYERLGEKYRHYFVDEFQDTSEMQWNNLIPLIGNALEGMDEKGRTGSLFLVGDAKQAIYRWRGGKAEQFIDLSTQKENPFMVPGEITTLPRNYRSYDAIINFNNSFFTNIGKLLENDGYRQLFLEGNRQECNHKEGGYVKLSFLEEATEDDFVISTHDVILQARSQGFAFGDICVLTRRKKEGIAVANYLMQRQIPIISSESLLLGSSPKVTFLINLLRYFQHPHLDMVAFEIASFLADEKRDKHDYLQNILADLEHALYSEFGFDPAIFNRDNLYDGIEYAIKKFRLAPESDAYLAALLDVVLDVEKQQGGDVQSFLTYWDKKEKSLSLGIPDNIDAVNIMTIHKSKGLEFPVVIYPFANTKIYDQRDPKLWVPVAPEKFSGFTELLLNKKKEVLEYGQVEHEIYQQEQEKLQLDAYNLLYVALTRAIVQLYVISSLDENQSGDYSMDKYSGLFRYFLQESNLWQDTKLEYTFGSADHKLSKPTPSDTSWDIPYIYTQKEDARFQVITKAGSLWQSGMDKAIEKGNIVHHIMADINTLLDVDKAIAKAYGNGLMENKEIAAIRDTILQLIGHPQLHKLFLKNNTVWNERDILLADGNRIRPDRVVLMDDELYIVDYKTGGKNLSYYAQLDEYALAYTAMGYNVTEKILIYISDKINVELL